MNITPVNIKLNSQNLKAFKPAQKFVRGMELKTILPLVLLECFVTGGRTVNAYNRGGFIEGRERFTEESLGAIFWFAGVKVLNKVNDFFLRKLLKIKDTNFDVSSDSIRNPLENYLEKVKQSGETISKNKIAAFKFTKVTMSVIMANLLVGFAVPKINQAITRMYQAKNKDNNSTKDFDTIVKNGFNTQFGIDSFIEQANTKNNKGTKSELNNPAFTGIAQNLLWFSHKLENDSYWQLLSTDVGVTGGRTISARNIHERIEILWRDLVSIFFYMFSMPLINSLMNKLEHGKNSRLNPVGAQQVTDYAKFLINNKSINPENKIEFTPEEFEKLMFGDNKYKSVFEKIKPNIKDGKIELNELKKLLESEFGKDGAQEFTDLAERMSKLQPKLKGVDIVSESQVRGMLEGGALNNPDFWNNVFTVEKGTSVETKVINGVKTKTEIANHKNPMKFISQKDLDGLINSRKDYVREIIENAKKNNSPINSDILEKICKKNLRLNAMNWGIGFAISALFLSTIIPKIQYWITRKMTGSNEFPGTKDYSYEKTEKQNKK